jgi:hypothetical protein
MQEIDCGPRGIRFEALPDSPDKGHEDIPGLEKAGIPDDNHLSSGQEWGCDEGFADTVDIFLFAVHYKEIELPVLGGGDEGLLQFFEGVMEAEFVIPAEEITGNALSPLQLREDRVEGSAVPCIVVLKCHLSPILTG